MLGTPPTHAYQSVCRVKSSAWFFSVAVVGCRVRTGEDPASRWGVRVHCYDYHADAVHPPRHVVFALDLEEEEGADASVLACANTSYNINHARRDLSWAADRGGIAR